MGPGGHADQRRAANPQGTQVGDPGRHRVRVPRACGFDVGCRDRQVREIWEGRAPVTGGTRRGRMRYMMLMYSRETPEGPSADEVEYLIRTHGAVVADARTRGALLAVEGLKPTKTA